jgi:hypothetical protein
MNRNAVSVITDLPSGRTTKPELGPPPPTPRPFEAAVPWQSKRALNPNYGKVAIVGIGQQIQATDRKDRRRRLSFVARAYGFCHPGSRYVEEAYVEKAMRRALQRAGIKLKEIPSILAWAREHAEPVKQKQLVTPLGEVEATGALAEWWERERTVSGRAAGTELKIKAACLQTASGEGGFMTFDAAERELAERAGVSQETLNRHTKNATWVTKVKIGKRWGGEGSRTRWRLCNISSQSNAGTESKKLTGYVALESHPLLEPNHDT